MPAKLKVRIKRFLGIDNVNESQKVNKGTLSVATNVDIQNDQSLSRRQGYTEAATGNFHSLWSNGEIALAVKDGELVRVFPDYSTQSLGNFSGVDSGVVFIDGKDGFIYCAGYGFFIRTDGVDVYTPDPLVKTEQKTYSPPVINNYEITDFGQVQATIKRNKTVIEGATVLEVYKGKMYAAMDKVLWISDSYDFMRILKLEKNFIHFSTNITAIKAADNGIYVSEEDKVWFLQGSSPSDFNFTVAYEDAGAIRGTDIRARKVTIGEQTIAPAIIWTTKEGICVGSDSGQVLNVTESKYNMPNFITGAAMFRQGGGLDQYLTVLNS